MDRRIAVAMALVAACGDGGGTSDGDAGVAVDAAQGGGPVSEDEAIAACITLGSCIGEGVADCFSDTLPLLDSKAIQCLIAAGADCTAVPACLGIVELVQDADCSASCDGDLAITCEEETLRYVVDCARTIESGPTCVEGNFGPECGGGNCSAEGTTCDGTRLATCDVDRGVLDTGDCADFGWTCVEDVDGARCTDGSEVTCADGTEPRCDGARLVRCSGGYELTFECERRVDTFQCFEFDDRAYCGLGDACDELNAKGTETCDGTAVTFCASGALRTIDCTELGFSTCVEGRGCGP